MNYPIILARNLTKNPVEACFLHRMLLKMRRVPEEAVFGTEYLFRTGKPIFAHRVPLKTRRVPEEAFLSTARIFGTVGGRFRYRVPSKEQGKGPPQWSGLPCLRRDNQVINLIEVRSFRRASENASHLGCPEHRKEGGSCLWEACLPPDGAREGFAGVAD